MLYLNPLTTDSYSSSVVEVRLFVNNSVLILWPNLFATNVDGSVFIDIYGSRSLG